MRSLDRLRKGQIELVRTGSGQPPRLAILARIQEMAGDLASQIMSAPIAQASIDSALTHALLYSTMDLTPLDDADVPIL